MKSSSSVDSQIIKYGIDHFAMILLVLCSGICLSVSTLTALILVECAHIIHKGMSYLWFMISIYTKKERIRHVIGGVLPGAIAILIFALLGKGLKDTDSKDVVNVITSIVTFAMILALIMPKSKEMKVHNNLLKDHVMEYAHPTAKEKKSFKFLRGLSRIMLIIGYLIAIVMTLMKEKYTVAIILTSVGCVFWAGYVAIGLRCWVRGTTDTGENSNVVDSGNDADAVGSYDEAEIENQNSDSSEQSSALNEREVKRIVEKIASRWSYREDTSSFVVNGRIRYSVSVEIPYEGMISYTINGKISCHDDEVSSAFTHLGGKMDKAAFKIKEETRIELEKHNFAGSYEIQVNRGSIERDR